MTKKQLLTKKQIIWIASAVGVVAILLGVCLFFLTNNVIRDVPNTIFVQKVDEDFVLNTQYNSKYMYNFKIEQNIEGKYVTLAVVKSDKNWLNLSGRQLDFAVGNKFRFSSCFSTENDSGNGSFCTPIEWTAYATLPEVDYQSVHVNLIENLITWDAVKNATQYQLSFVAES